MKALDLEFLDTFSVTNGTKEIGLSYLKNSFSAADNLTFAITGGADKDLFSIDATTGVLTFNEQAFVNTALDFDRDGIYDVQITVSGSDPGDTQTANLGVEVVYDLSAPEVSITSFTHALNEDGETVITLTGQLTDDGSGMIDGSLSIHLKHALSGEQFPMTFGGGEILIDSEGNFTITRTMDASDPDGLWYIYNIRVEDKAGNATQDYVYQYGNSLAYAEFPNALYLGSSDKTAPQISITTFTHALNEDGETVITLTGQLTDDGSGMIDGSLSIHLKHALSGEQFPMTFGGGEILIDSEGNFTITRTMDASDPDGLWYIYNIRVEDKAGNATQDYVYQYGNSLAYAEFPNALYLGSSDKTAPQISITTFTHALNEDGETVITLTGQLTDDGSGMIDGSLSIHLKHALSGEQFPMTFGGGEILIDSEGNFTITRTMDASDPDGLWYIYNIRVEDKAGNATQDYVYQYGNSLAYAEFPNALYLGGLGGSPDISSDNTAPVLKTLEVSTYTENGSVYIKVTGNVTDTNFSSLNLTFSLAGNPEAKTISLGISTSNYSGATYGYTYDATTGDFTAYRVLTDANPGGTYYLDHYSTYDEAGNNVYQGITGSTDTPLFGGSVVIDNPNAIIDNTAPVLKTLEVSTYTENGSVYIKVTGNVTDTNFSSLNLTFSLAGNPEAKTISLGISTSNYSGATYGYTYDATTGDFTAYRVLTDANPGGTYYLDHYSTYDEAGNNVYQGITGSTDTPLFGGSVVIDNPNAIIDNTAPVLKTLEVSTYTENGSVYIKVTGNVTDTNFSSLNLTFSLAGNPEAKTISLGISTSNYSGATYGYTYDATTGDFTAYRVLTDANPGGTYYLDHYSTYDEAGNNVYQGITGSTDTPLFGGSVTIAKDAPTSISIAASDLDEGQLGTSLGKIQVNAKDGYGLFTLSITGADAGLLEISSLGYLRLKSNVSLDFDDQQTLSFKITATNTLGESFDRSYSLSIQDLQLAPTAVLIDGVNDTTVQVEENQTGILVGNLSTTDGDDADTHTYALSEESEIFEISNNALKLKDGVAFNFEDQNSYTLTIITTDSTGLSYSETFTIQVTDINEAPTDITLASLNIPERLDGAEIGLITVSDVDANESFTISVNDDRFEVVNNVLKLKDTVQLEFSQVEQVTLIVTVTDSGGNSLQESFTLLVGSIQLDVYGVDENTPGSSVGTLSVSDSSVTGEITYVLSGDDADEFEVLDGVLKLKSTATADFETKSSYTLTVLATGANNVSVEATLIINVNDLNDAPTGISISGDLSISENKAGASIGTLSTTDQDAGDTFVYSISGADADVFEIVNGALKLKTDIAANYELKDTYSITLTSTDAGGLQVSTDFEIQVSNVAEAPTAIIVSKEDPAPPPNPGEGETITVVVTVENGQFYFNGELQSEFKLIHGNTYIFEQSVGANGHVLGISATNGGASVDGLSYSYTTGPSSAPNSVNVSTYTTYLTTPAYVSFFSSYTFAITYTVPEDGPDTLYFFSASSAVTGGTFNVGSAYVPPTPVDPDAITINENELGALVGNLSVTDEDAGDTHTYTLSGADADLFEIVDGQLKLVSNVAANYELKSSYSIIITATDSTGLSYANTLVISVSDVNEAPTGVLLSSLRVEDDTDGVIVGDLSTVDQDTNDTYTYTLSGDDADKFEVVNGQLKLKNGVAADYDTQSTYSVTVTSTDSGGETATQTFTLNVVTTINLTSFSFAENTAGVVVGDLSVTDENFSSNVTYSLSGADGDQFEIVNNQLKLKDGVAANFEVKDAYAIVITVKDDAGLEAIINFSLSVTDQPDAPTAISLSQEEPEPPAPPPNPGEGETITVVVTVENGQFYFNGELQSEFKLIHGNTYIFEQSVGANGHVLGISATNGGASVDGLSYSYTTGPSSAPNSVNVSTYTTYLTTPAYVSFFSSYTFAITYTVPEDGPDTLYFFSASSAVTGGTFNVGSGYVPPPAPPTPVDPDAIVINENELGAVVGTLLTTDEDAGDTHTYTLSGADADLFEIVDGKLKLKGSVSINYENTPSLNVTITATDSTNQSVSQDFVIKIADQNDSPTGVLLSSLRVEDDTDGVIVGDLSTVDQDTNDTYTYTLSGDDADKFEVVNGQLKLKNGVAADYDTQSTYSVTVTSTDSGGETATQTFTLNVVTTINLTSFSFAENTAGVVVGDLSVTDENFSSNVTYSLSGADGDQFEIVNNQLKLKDGVAANFEVKDAYAIVITVKDDAGLEAIINFSLSVTDQPDAPTAISLSQEEPEPPAPPPNPGEGETITVVVTVENGQFYFNGELQSEFKLIHGNTYIFEQSVGANGHVLGISATNGGASVDGLSYSYTTGPSSAPNSVNVSTYTTYLTTPAYVSFFSSYTFAITYTVPEDGPDTLYFFSASSAVTGGTFNVGSGYVPPPAPPTPVDPDAIVINENELGAVVGTLLTTDEDAGDTHTYTLSGADADLFEIVDGKLKLKDSIASNYENKSILNIDITATDQSGLSFTQSIAVTVNNVNEQPTQINLSQTSFDEAIAGAIVGTLLTVDEDIDDTYVYTLSGTDADLFEVIEGVLKLKADITADYETLSTYSVTVTSTDSGGLSVSQDFNLTVNNVNEPVTSITLGTLNYVTVFEGEEGAIIGDFIINDPDLNEIRTYLLTGRDAKYFEVVDGRLKVKSGIALDYENLFFTAVDADGNILKALDITVTVIDSEGYTAKNDFNVYVLNANDAPYGIFLEGSSINNGQGVVGRLIVSDNDDHSFTYTTDNDNFEVVDGYLKVKSGVTLSAELWDTLSIEVTATDSSNNSITQIFNLTHVSVDLDSYSFNENVENPVVAHINQSVKNSDFLNDWTYSLSGSDSRLFKINADNDIEFVGSADYETRSTYDLVIVFTHSSGFSYESMQTISVLDTNDAPNLWYSHANNLAFYNDDVNAGSQYSFGIIEETTNPYIMTLEYGDQDPNDSYSIQITYRPYSGYFEYDQNGNWKPAYNGNPVDITDLFTFDQGSGALFFNGSTDFESRSGEYSGLNGNSSSSHLWHEPITITITDSSGASSSMTILMNVWDNASDGQFNLSFNGSYTNFNNEASYSAWIGGLGDSDTGLWPTFDALVKGDLNGDNIPDLVAWMSNRDYGYDIDGNYGALPENYSYLRISLGGEYSYPHYDGTGRSGFHDVFGQGKGSVYVILPTPFSNPIGVSPWNDIREYQFEGLDIGDFNGDGKDDVIFQIYSPYTDKDYLVIGYGQDFDASSFNVMDLSNVFTDETYGRVIDLTEYSDNYLYIKDTGDLNGDGKDDIILIDSGDTVVVIQGAANGVTPSSISLSIGLNEQDINYGDFLGIAIGDFNGDGRDDLAVSSEMYDKTLSDIDDGGIFIYLNGFNGSSSPSITIVGNVSAQLGYGGIMNLGDINGDGYDDLGFSDDDGTEWIYWGNPSSFESIDLGEFPGSISNISSFQNYSIDFDDVTAIGDINADGYDDLAFGSYGSTTILYGMPSWQNVYNSDDGLNLLEIINTNSSAIFSIGDWDQDGKDEFVFAGDSSLGYSWRNYLKIWQGDDAFINTNGFSLSIEKNSFEVDEISPGALVGSIIISDDANSNQYDYFIQRVYVDGSHSDGGVIVENLWFDISSNGEITLKPGVSLNAEEHSMFTLRVYIVDNANDQISQHYIQISVNNINEAPTFTLSNRMVDDTAAAGTVIGALASTDAEGDDVTFALSGADADMFIIDAETNEIRFADGAAIDINSQVSFEVTITATDALGLESFENILIEINVAPSDLTLDTNIVQESVRGAAIGQLNVTDQNASDEFTYSISGEDAWMFNVTSEGVLELADEIYIDFETKSVLNITITAKDALGKSVTKDFSINAVDINYSNPHAVDIVTPNWVVPKSGWELIDGLIFGFTLDPDYDFNTPLTITYSFVDTDSVFYGSPPEEVFASTESFELAVSSMFADISKLLGINFVLVEETDSVVGDIRCGLYYEESGVLGFCEVSGIRWGNLGIYVSDTGSSSQNLWFNTANFDQNNINKGDGIYTTIVHEIGHALGLAHPQSDVYTPYAQNNINNYFQGSVQAAFEYYGMDNRYMGQYIGIGDSANRLINILDWQGYTVMSYDEYPNSDWSSTEDNYFGHAGHHDESTCVVCNAINQVTTVIETGAAIGADGFMTLDIYALMYIYNYDAESDTWNVPPVNNGDTTYVIDGPVFKTIHDTGGVDTIDLSAFDFDINFDISFYGWSYDEDSGQWISSYKHNEIGTNLLSYEGGEFTSGYILNLSPFSVIENLILGSGNDTVELIHPYGEVQNLVLTGEGNDIVYGVSWYDNIYTEAGSDVIRALSKNFSLIDGGLGYDKLSISQELLENGLYSIDFRSITPGQIQGIEELDYSVEMVGGEGQILVSLQTFKSLGKNELVIKATWQDNHEQAIGLEGGFKFSGSTDNYDVYTIFDAGQTFSLYVWKDHYVYQIDDSILEISLSNNIVAEETWRFVGEISLSGETWINPAGSLYSMNFTAIYTLSGDDAEMFEVIEDQLYFISQPDYETKSSYSVTITGLSLSGKTISKTFTIEVKDVDETSYTAGDDVIIGTGSSDYLYGGSGNDTISGGEGDDHLTGGSGNDILRGEAGNDSLFGWGGEDEIHGGSGDDLIYGHEDTDKLYGDEGKDTIYGWGGNDQIEGGSNDDEIYGDSGNDIIFGDSEVGEQDSDGNDSINAGSGNDQVWGRGGDDIIFGGSGEDSLRGGSGHDVIRGGGDNDVIVGQSGNDTLSGDSGNDIIYGDRETGESSDDGNDILWGGFGDDELFGRGGDDYLIGQNGLDVLTGGEGADTFVLTSYSGANSKDTIKDYVDGTDKIGLINIDFDSLTITQDDNAVDTNIADADGNIIAVLEGVTATDIDAGDFVSLDYDLSEILEVTPSMVNLDLISLGVDEDIAPDGDNEVSGSADSSDSSSSGSETGLASDNNSSNSNALISGDLIDSLVNHTEDLSLSFNDFI